MRRDAVTWPNNLAMACRECGFFYVVGHGVDEQLCARLEELSRQFFAWSTSEKMRIGMSQGGRAWRGYFSVGDELTSGRPDQKEGLYFGAELADDHPSVLAGTPLARQESLSRHSFVPRGRARVSCGNDAVGPLVDGRPRPESWTG